MLAFAAFLLLFADNGGESLERSLKSFVEVFAAVEENAADPVNPSPAIFEGAIPGMLRRLDPLVMQEPNGFRVTFSPWTTDEEVELLGEAMRTLARESC